MSDLQLFTFPKDSAGKAGAVKPTPDGYDFFVPVQIQSGDVVLPVEVRQHRDRELEVWTNSNLVANAVFTGTTIDALSAKYLVGQITTTHSGTLYFQQSDDGTNWSNASTIEVTAGSTVSIDGTSYRSSTTFNFETTVRYVRLIYVNGATATTSFTLSAYTSVI